MIVPLSAVPKWANHLIDVGKVCEDLRGDAILPAEFYRSMGPNFEQIIGDALQQARNRALEENDETLAAICKWLAGFTAPRDPELCRSRARHILNELRALRSTTGDGE